MIVLWCNRSVYSVYSLAVLFSCVVIYPVPCTDSFVIKVKLIVLCGNVSMYSAQLLLFECEAHCSVW